MTESMDERNKMKRWGDPVIGFPRVGDEATEEHDKRIYGHGAHKGNISYNTSIRSTGGVSGLYL